MKKYLLFAVALFSLFVINTKAISSNGFIQSGDSVAGKVKIGSNYVGSSNFYWLTDQTWNSFNFSGDFDLDIWEVGSGDKLHFGIDFCISGNQPTINIWSSYVNSVDFYYPLGKEVYLTNEDWAVASCYRAFVTLKINSYLNAGTQLDTPKWYDISFDNNVFAVFPNNGYGPGMKFIDMIYYNINDFNSAIETARIYSKNNDIINKQEQTNNKLDDVNKTQKETNSKLDDIKNLQPDNSESPDKSKYDDYNSAQNSLIDKIDSDSIDNVDIAIDTDTSNFIWDTITDLLNSHPLIMSTMIAMLGLGIIKLAFGR